ncbi:MAG: LysM peptidoglycan-binding domain-containing protein [Chlamydiota bacterium]
MKKQRFSHPLALLLFVSCFSGCSLITSSPKEEKHQLELSLHKVRTDVEELKHDLNTYEIEHHILEGKLIDQGQIAATLKDQVAHLKQGKLQSFLDQLEHLNEKLQDLSVKQEQIAHDIRQLSSHANGTTTALSQYKMKIAEIETAMKFQQNQLQEIIALKAKIAALAAEPADVYVVKSGDSLGKIARQFNFSVEEIKEYNQLLNDRIMPGQKIKLPRENTAQKE